MKLRDDDIIDNVIKISLAYLGACMNVNLAQRLKNLFQLHFWILAFAYFGLNLSPAAAQSSSDVKVFWAAENSGLYIGESSTQINPIPVNQAGAFILYSSPEAACNFAVTHNLSPLDRLVSVRVNEVEEIYHNYSDSDYPGESFNQTVVGQKCLFTYKFFTGIPPDQEEKTITDSWYNSPIARPVCARPGGSALANYEVEFGDVGASCVNSADKSDNEDPNSGETVSSGPRVTVGDPIEVDTGAAVSTVVDYGTADSMLSINRNYRSAGSMRGGMIAKNIEPGFGLKWRGLLPGHMLFCNNGTNVTLRYTDERGGQTSFSVSAGAAWSFVSREETRLTVNMLAPAAESPLEFILAPAAPGTGATETAEFRVVTATGDAIHFRRAGEYSPLDQCRRAVPVRKVLANGYIQNYTYGSSSDVYPNSISDNLGRQIGISWRDAGKIGTTISGVFSGPDATGAEVAALQPLKVISRLELPDGTSMQYDYTAIGTSGFLGNLSQAKRVAADGISILWAQGYLYEDASDKSALTGISDLNGNRISTFAYGANGRAIKTEGNGGFGTYSISYDEENDVRIVTNPLGLKTTYQYTSQEGFFNVSVINPGPTDPNSPPPPPPVDCGGDCYSETAVSLSRLPRLLYSKSTEATANVESEEFRFGYDFKGQVNNRTDANGRVSVINNISGEGRPSMFTDARGVKTSIAWHPTLDLPTRTVRKRLQTDFGYDAAGQLTSSSVTDLDSGEVRTTQYEMGVAGRVLSVNGPRAPDAQGRDDITNMTYDAQGNMLTMANPFGHVTRFEGYDANGRAARMFDPNGAVTEFTYDALGRVKTSIAKHPTDPTKDAVTGMDYDIEGRVVAVTRPDTAKLNFDYNLAGLMTAIRSDDGERIDYSYDPMGNRLSETVQRADGSQVSNIQRTFDEIGRMLSITLGPGRTHRYAYDKVGNVVRQTTARGGVQLNSYDALNRLVQTVAPDGASFSNRYDGDSERVSILDTESNTSLVVSPGSGAENELGLFKDGVGGKTRFTRNAFGQVTQEISPARGTTLYEYDAAGDLKAMVDGRGQRIEYTRDILGRVLTKTPVGRPASERVTYTYDTATVNGSFAIGRLSRVDDGSGATRFSYDHRGNMILRYQRLVGSTDWVALRYRYDLADRIDLITYPSGRQVLYVRDAKGRVSAVRTRGSNTAGAWTTVSSAMTYEAFGPLRTIAYGNGERMIVSYGDDGRMDGRRLFRTADGTNISHLVYGYDADDNIIRITDRLDATKTMRFTYDAVNRLTRVTAATGSVQRTDYAFDKNGNRTEVLTRPLATDPASAATAEIYQNNLATLNSQLEAIIGPNGTRSFVYDARGNLISETRPGGITINTAYDGYGRLTGYARSGEASLTHVYNGLDDRVATTTMLAGGGSDTRRFIYAPDGRVLGEYGANASDVRAEFIWMSPEVGDAGQFGGDDGLGGYMPLAVSTPDPIAGAGATQLSWVHASHMGVPLRYSDAAGQTLTLPTSYSVPGFPGQSQTFADLYYNRYRDYDSSTGRYIQADPIGLAGGPSPYSYAMNNPLRYTDPTGKFVPLCFAGAAAGALATGLGEVLVNGKTSLGHVLAGAAAGCVAGAAAPFVATSVTGAVILNGVTNVGQYIATQIIDGKAITPGGLALNAVLGGIAGKSAGAVRARGKEYVLDVLPWQGRGTYELHRNLNEQRYIDAAARGFRGSVANGFATNIFGNDSFREQVAEYWNRVFK